MIKLALGKSIPTSITVVETSIDIFFLRNSFKTFSFSFLSKAPWINPTLFGNFWLIKSNFFLAEEDLKLRGFGDLIGYQQSGIKNFRFADPVIHGDLFKLAEKYVIDNREEINQNKYSFLLKLFDKAEVINVSEI